MKGKILVVVFAALFLSGALFVFAEVSIGSLLLAASSPNNSTEDNLNCSYNLAGDATTTATNWYKNGTSQMVLYIPMEGNVTNALLDYSGNGNNGTNVGETTWNSSGGYDGNGAFQFNGTNYIDAGFSMPTGAYTKSAWIKFIPVGVVHNIISGNTGGHALFITNDGGYRLWAGHNGAWNSVWDPTPFTENVWIFVTLTYDPLVDNGTLILYRNGAEVAKATDIPTIVADTRVLLGSYSGGGLLNGTIDDARVYAHALSSEQISELYNNGGNVIVSSETQIGDEWQCRVTPFNSTEGGATEASNILTILERPIINVTMDLMQGWNSISTPIELINKTVKKVLEDINYTKLFTFRDNTWYELNDNSSINETLGYWINSSNNQKLTIQGKELNYGLSNFGTGWNLIGYPSLTAKSVNETLNVSKINSVLMYNNSVWYSYNPDRLDGINTLKQINPGYGYWVNAK